MKLDRREVLKRTGTLAAGLLVAPKLLRGSVPGGAPAATLPAVTFHNLQPPELLPEGGWRLSRVPAELLPRLNSGAQRRALSPAGAEIRFNLVGSEARIRLRKVENRGAGARHLPAIAEVHHGDFLADWADVRDEWTEILVKRPANAELLAKAAAEAGAGRFPLELVRIALPYLPDIHFGGIDGDVSPARPDQVPARRYLAYGSSITNGAFATRPGELYPARVARALGVDHFNLGFGGGAYLEPEMGAWFARRQDWDFATLEMGVNIVTRLTREEFAARVDGFLPQIVAAHPDKFIFCIDIFGSGRDLVSDPRHIGFRQVVRETVAKINSPKVIHCSGPQLLTRKTGLSLDLLHPAADGFEEIAQRLIEIMRPAV